jgi:hypothetical protein
VVFQANPELALFNIFLCQVQWAGAQWYGMFNEIEQLPHLPYRSIGTKIPGTILDLLTRKENPGERFILDNYIRVGLVVFQVDVEQGLKLLDQ